ncbi:MAG: beta-galactosidase [Actinomycetales bacterium]|nr:beta-galactosidase [Actinomycetales bacterium]
MPPRAWPVRLSPIAFGGDYTPEQWPDAVRREDVALMREAGVTAVTVGVFAWAMLEPAEGRYTFGWLDTVLDRLAEAGIAVDLATPTAAPPPWFSTTYPETLPVARDGSTLGIGARESFCPSSSRYRDAATGIARRLAERYRDHPALAMWHVNNEYGAHVAGCHCPESERSFREWLRTRHGDLDALNEAWGTAFWSQRYQDWAEITVPRVAPMPVNPAQQLDFHRFTDDEFRACFRAERDAIRELTPDIPITTNFMATACPRMDYWRWADEVDVVANNHYLVAEDPEGHVELAMSADVARSLNDGSPWVLMEHSTSAVNWQPRNLAKAPGQLRRNSLTHVARGADAAMFFQWRASRAGAEKFHSAMLPHGGTRTRVWHEVTALGSDLSALREIAGSRVTAEVGMLWDWESWWALELEYRPSIDVTYLDAVRRFYAALWRRNETVDFVRPGADPSKFRLLVVPSLYLTTPTTAAVLRTYVEGGGRLLVSFFSGIVDEHDAVHPGGFPGPLREVLGLWIDEFHPLPAAAAVHLDPAPAADTRSRLRLRATVWSEEVVCEGAEVIWRFADGPDCGLPALTRHPLGAGAAWYLATRPDGEGVDRVLDLVLADAGITGGRTPEGVEAVRRASPLGSYLFLVNHGPVDTTVPGGGVDLLTGERWADGVRVPAGGVTVVREDRTADGDTHR